MPLPSFSRFLAGLLGLIAVNSWAWSNHTLATYRALEAMPELVAAAPVSVEPLESFLKTLANGGSYGIFAEYHQLDPVSGDGAKVHAHGLWPLDCRVRTPEEPGEFCFPPLAATVTASARLLLALLQASVEARGGTYASPDRGCIESRCVGAQWPSWHQG